MPFRLMNALATFHHTMDRTLLDVTFTKSYVHGVVIFSKDMEEHLLCLVATVSRVWSPSLKINISKCRLSKEIFELLGHLVSVGGVTVNLDKMNHFA